MKSWGTTTRWVLGAQLAARALGLVHHVLLARLLAPVAFGEFTQAMALTGALAPLADTGVSAVMTRHVARRRRALGVLGAALGLRLAQAGWLWTMTLLGAWWLSDALPMRTALVLAGAYWGLACGHQLLAAVARARLEAHLETRAVLLERAATVLLAATGAWWLGVVGALAGGVAGGVLALAFYLRVLRLPRWRFRWMAWKRLLVLGAPLAVADLCHGVIMRLDLLAVGMRYGAQSAGWYGSASALLWASNLVAGSMALALVPVAASRGEGAEALSGRVLGWMVAVATLLATALSLGAHLWVPLLFGEDYTPAVEVLHVLAWCLIPASVVAWGNAVLLVRGHQRRVGIVAAGGLLGLALCLWWWLPRGLLGASGAQLAAQCGMATALWWWTRRP